MPTQLLQRMAAVFCFTSFALLLLPAASVLAAQQQDSTEQDPQLTPLETRISALIEDNWQPDSIRKTDERRQIWKQVRKFYSDNDFSPIWIGDQSATESMLVQLHQSPRHGLVKAEYDSNRLIEQYLADQEQGMENIAVDRQARLELAFSAALLALAHDLWDGRVEPQDVQGDHLVYLERKPLDAQSLLAAVGQQAIEDLLAELTPQHEEYERLQQALIRHLEQMESGEFTQLQGSGVVRTDDVSPEVKPLVNRLREAGLELPDQDKPDDEWVYTEAIADAVSELQRRAGLAEDGLLGDNTRAYLNQGMDHRRKVLAANLDRWRWLPRDLGNEYILVNIPDYQLRAFKNDELHMRMRIIVGEVLHKTPVFADMLEYAVLNPYWNIPNSIIQDELLPQFKDDPAVVFSKNMEVLDLDNQPLDPTGMDWSSISAADIRVRQKPGPENSLGLVKFIFPNSHAIYFHDTPADQLFDPSKRAFSHGCLRLERPRDLATYLLSDVPDWNRERIESVMGNADEPTTVDMNRQVPVFITYFTATGFDAGDDEVRYLNDIYGHDAVMFEALENEAPNGKVLSDHQLKPVNRVSP